MADTPPPLGTPAQPPPGSALGGALGGARARFDELMQRRLRWVTYLSFLALALALAAQAWNTLRLEGVRASDAQVIDKAGQQAVMTQQIARHATLLVAELGGHGSPADEAPSAATRTAHGATLALLLQRSMTDCAALDALLTRQMSLLPDHAAGVAPAQAAWHRVRGRLWASTQALLEQTQAPTPTPLPAPSNTGETLHAALQAVLFEADASLAQAQDLSETLHRAATLRGDRVRNETWLWLAGMLALLAVLTLRVVEPTARAVRRQLRRLAEQAITLQRLALVIEHTQAMVLISNADDRVEWANPAFARVTGWNLVDVQGRRPRELLDNPHADPLVQSQLRTAVADGRSVRVEVLSRTRDGLDLWLDVDLHPMHDDCGQLLGHFSLCTDITARTVQQQKMLALWAALPAGVAVQDEAGTIVDANLAAERLLGLSLAQLQGRSPLDRRWRAVREDGSDYPGHEHPAMRTLASGQALFDQTMGIHTPEGTLRWLSINTQPQHDPIGRVTGVVACFSDITERRHLQDQLHAHARTDALTQLPNRAVALDRLQRAIAHATRHPEYGFAVLFMDFDRFKHVNDTLGHAAGDELLRQISKRLVLALRPGDALARIESGLNVAARMGGDEFVVVLEGVTRVEDVKAVAERVLAELGEPYNVGAHPVHSSASIGIVLWQAQQAGHTTTAEDMLRNADTAMYEAKRAGRGRCVLFDDSMHERVVRALAVESDLRVALKDEQLFVVYQPVVDLASQALVGVEALVRWHHPERGLISPMDFIPVAEECGLIDAVGRVVLEKACAQFMRWRVELGAHAPRQLAVNLSRAQLKRVGLVEEVGALLAALDMPPALLQLEITETLAAQDERIQNTLRDLKSLGVKLALDDFGTGYSSLACLHQLPVDTVKIDRSFVQFAQDIEYHRVLIEATIRVARTLGMTTVAEGIETEAQAALMRSLDCDRGQGYLFGRPMEAADLQAWQTQRQQGLVELV